MTSSSAARELGQQFSHEQQGCAALLTASLTPNCSAVDPNNLTDEQERLLKLAIARQSRHATEARLKAKLHAKERLRAERDRKLQLLGDQKRLTAYMQGARYAGVTLGRLLLLISWACCQELPCLLVCMGHSKV